MVLMNLLPNLRHLRHLRHAFAAGVLALVGQPGLAACLAPAQGTLAPIEVLAFREPNKAMRALEAIKGDLALADARAQVHWQVMAAEAQRQLSDVPRSRQHATEAVRLLAGDRSSDLAVRARTALAMVAADGEASQAEFDNLVQISADKPLALGCVLRDRGWSWYLEGDVEKALSDLTRAQTLLGQYGDRDDQHVATGRLSSVYHNGADAAGALSLVDETVQHFRQTGANVRLGTALGRRADILMRLKRFEEAEATALEAVALAEKGAEKAGAGYQLTTLCEIRLQQGDAPGALAYCARAEATLIDSGKIDDEDRAVFAVLRAEILRGKGLPERDLATLQARMQDKNQQSGFAARIQAAMALVYAASGNHRAAYDAQMAQVQHLRKNADGERIKAQALMRARFGTQYAESKNMQLAQDKLLAENRLWLAWALASSALLVVAALTALAVISAKQRKQLRRLAEVDDLTNLPNRRKIVQTASQAITQRGAATVVLGVIDVDWFKSINDRFGHDVGDQVLKQLALMAPQALQGAGTVGRYGGEEFLLVLPNTDMPSATAAAERLRAAVAQHAFSVGGETPLRFTVSIGLAAARASDTAFDKVVQRADSALYRAKAGGRDRVEVFDNTAAVPSAASHAEPRSHSREVIRS
jgi:diguanylate cyclase (GGDEF)-like protein